MAIDWCKTGFGEGLSVNFGRKSTDRERLSNAFIELISKTTGIKRIFGYGNSKRFQIVGNHKRFLVKVRSEIKNSYYWFGIGEEASRTFNDKNSYLILLCGSLKEVIIMPMPFIMEHLLKIPTVTADQWKFNIIKSVGTYVLAIPKLTKMDVTPLLNKYDALFNENEIKDIKGKIKIIEQKGEVL